MLRVCSAYDARAEYQRGMLAGYVARDGSHTRGELVNGA